MKIIEHRGGWCQKFELYDQKNLQNTIEGFEKSFSRGNGAEIDVRDICGNLVVAHNTPNGRELLLSDLLEVYNKYDSKGTLALNIKSDGLQLEVKKIIEEYKINNYFVFDMSIPDTIGYINNNLSFFIRNSEWESYSRSSDLYEKAHGIWLDQFCDREEPYATYERLRLCISDRKQVCIVSPELHSWGRIKSSTYKEYWSVFKIAIKQLQVDGLSLNNLFICTDFPEEAKGFFIHEK